MTRARMVSSENLKKTFERVGRTCSARSLALTRYASFCLHSKQKQNAPLTRGAPIAKLDSRRVSLRS